MTLVISAITSSGIVLTADSRQTYRNQAGVIRTGSNSAMKVFRLSAACGVAISGRAFVNEADQPVKDVGFFITRFASREGLDGITTRQVADKLNAYLEDLYVSREISALQSRITSEVAGQGGTDLVFHPPDGHLVPYSYKDSAGRTVSPRGWIETIDMIVAGIDSDGVGCAYLVTVPKGVTMERDTQQCGALWVGQGDVLGRIIKGFAPEMHNLTFVKEALARDSAGTMEQLNKLEYIINWGTITIQDAVDLCVLLTQTTESVQRFSDGTWLSPGGTPGVGGEIDIAVITPEAGFQWLKKRF